MTEKEFREKYQERVQGMTLDELPAFIKELLNQDHDYGTIVIAMGLAAAATAWACNEHPSGGITGFQAGFVTWEFARHWGTPKIGDAGARFLDYDDLLYPQYEDKFTTIPESSLKAVQGRARELLEKNQTAAERVRAHWEMLAAGGVPFGLRVSS